MDPKPVTPGEIVRVCSGLGSRVLGLRCFLCAAVCVIAIKRWHCSSSLLSWTAIAAMALKEEGFGQSAGCSGISAKNKNTGKNAFDTRKSSSSSDDKN